MNKPNIVLSEPNGWLNGHHLSHVVHISALEGSEGFQRIGTLQVKLDDVLLLNCESRDKRVLALAGGWVEEPRPAVNGNPGAIVLEVIAREVVSYLQRNGWHIATENSLGVPLGRRSFTVLSLHGNIWQRWYHLVYLKHSL